MYTGKTIWQHEQAAALFVRDRSYGRLDFHIVADRRSAHRHVQGRGHLLDYLHRRANTRRGRRVVEDRHVLDRVTLTPGGVHIRYDASGYCGHDRSSSVIHPSFPWMRLNRSPSCDRRAK